MIADTNFTNLREDNRRTLGDYLVNGGISNKKFVGRDLITGNGSLAFDHQQGIPLKGQDVYEVLEFNEGRLSGVNDSFVRYVCVLVRTSKKINGERLSYVVPLVDHLHDRLTTPKEIERAKEIGFLREDGK